MIAANDCLFNPEKMGLVKLGIHELVNECIMQADYELRRELFNNIVLSGGNFNSQGMPAKFNEYMHRLVPNNFKLRVEEVENYQNLAWMGGSIVSSLQTFQQNWITKPMLDEHGPSIILRKCL